MCLDQMDAQTSLRLLFAAIVRLFMSTAITAYSIISINSAWEEDYIPVEILLFGSIDCKHLTQFRLSGFLAVKNPENKNKILLISWREW